MREPGDPGVVLLEGMLSREISARGSAKGRAGDGMSGRVAPDARDGFR